MLFALLAVLVVMDISAAFLFWITGFSAGLAPTMIVAGLLLACVSVVVARSDAEETKNSYRQRW
ncbi:hypothetical protein SD71_10530 [Cohnella kolymensis]|uniref:Uncharacterized protein n=1 Tax=Cohnella kolymensis TaxID=1590652 RepID=A0ABR5A5J1_9BACL|nr:hypothetical protein [Cohnella kolymensis]KIL35830.1 hypothetical protein SD71_10530 [Cohnella kolymensis]